MLYNCSGISGESPATKEPYPINRKAIDARLTAKVGPMAQVLELYAAPDRDSYENSLEWWKLMFGEDAGIADPESVNESARAELIGMGYNFADEAASVVHGDADDLLHRFLGVELDADTMEGMIWAARNCPVDWP